MDRLYNTTTCFISLRVPPCCCYSVMPPQFSLANMYECLTDSQGKSVLKANQTNVGGSYTIVTQKTDGANELSFNTQQQHNVQKLHLIFYWYSGKKTTVENDEKEGVGGDEGYGIGCEVQTKGRAGTLQAHESIRPLVPFCLRLLAKFTIRCRSLKGYNCVLLYGDGGEVGGCGPWYTDNLLGLLLLFSAL